MIKTKTTIVIDRRLPEVFDYVTEVRNFPAWFTGVIKSARQTSPGPMAQGATFEVVGQFLGRRVDVHFVVTRHEPDRLFCVASDWGVLPFQGCFHFEPVANGTLVTDRHSIDPSGLFALVGSLLVTRLKQQAEANLANLKRVLESQPAGPTPDRASQKPVDAADMNR
jgi:Polyketide cyclase / dehydrase and lipid transport